MRAGRLPRPSRGALALLAAALLLEAIGRLLSSGWVTLAAAGLLGAVIADAALTPSVRRIAVTRHTATRMTCGADALTQLSASPQGARRRSVGPFVVIDGHPALPAASAFIPRLCREQVATAALHRTPERRGHWVGGTVTIEGRSPLGGFTRRRTIAHDDPVWVHPAIAGALAPARRPTPGAAGAGSSGRSGPGEEIFGLREWRPGDAVGAVHGRASARRGRPVVLDREQPAESAQVIAFGQPGAGPDWERAVARAAATAMETLRAGRRLTLVSGRAASAPTSAPEALDWFAALEADEPADAARVTEALGRAGGTVLWLSATSMPPSVAAVIRAKRTAVQHLGLVSDVATAASR